MYLQTWISAGIRWALLQRFVLFPSLCVTERYHFIDSPQSFWIRQRPKSSLQRATMSAQEAVLISERMFGISLKEPNWPTNR